MRHKRRNGLIALASAAAVGAYGLAPTAGSMPANQARSEQVSSACSTRQLHVHYTYAFELMAQAYVTLAFRNASSHSCSLSGWPRVVGEELKGHLESSVRIGVANLQAKLLRKKITPGQVTVALRPGEDALSFLVSPAVAPSSRPDCTNFKQLSISPPSNNSAVTISASFASHLNMRLPACGRLFVTQVLPTSLIRKEVGGG